MAESSDQRALATRLSGMSDEQLSIAFRRRGLSTGASWHDWFDAAEGLLDAASVDRALTRLPRVALRAVSGDAGDSGSAGAADLSALLLAGEDGVAYGMVRERAAALADARPEVFAPTPEVAAPGAADAAATAAIAERVFRTLSALADVVLAATLAPLARTGAGGISAVDRRRLVEAEIVESAEQLEDLAAVAASAGLLSAVDREWAATDEGDAWLRLTSAARWAAVVDGFRAALPEALRTPDGGYEPVAGWLDAFPLDADWPARAQQLQRTAVAWGLVAGHDATGLSVEPAWATPVRLGEPATPAPLAAELPAEIDRVYLQADLTAIAPGPLAPELDLRLRTVARRESRAQASTYRFDADTVAGAMTGGETAASLTEFLSGLSLTGIPQPLAYLIESAAARHGRVTVRQDAATGHTLVASDDDAMLATIEVDQSLRPLGLVADDGGLVTRVSRDSVYWALADARYPVMAVDGAGDALPLRRGRRAGADAAPPVADYARLLATLRSGGGGGDADAAWLERELDLAVRSRGIIVVDVRLPDGTQRSFTLEASGLGGGRLRGRDKAADVERTLPLSSIVSVRPGT